MCLSLSFPTQPVHFYSSYMYFPSSAYVPKSPHPSPWLAQSGPSYWVPQWNTSICGRVLTSSVKLVLRCMSYKATCIPVIGEMFSDKIASSGAWQCFRPSLQAVTENNSKHLKGKITVCPHERASLHPDPNNRNSEEAASYFDKEPPLIMETENRTQKGEEGKEEKMNRYQIIKYEY